MLSTALSPQQSEVVYTNGHSMMTHGDSPGTVEYVPRCKHEEVCHACSSGSRGLFGGGPSPAGANLFSHGTAAQQRVRVRYHAGVNVLPPGRPDLVPVATFRAERDPRIPSLIPPLMSGHARLALEAHPPTSCSRFSAR